MLIQFDMDLNEKEVGVLIDESNKRQTSINNMIKDLIFDIIEDEQDTQIVNQYLESKANGTLEVMPFFN